MKKGIGYLKLMRPANSVTAAADVLAGITLSGFFTAQLPGAFVPVLLLCISTMGLYGGGVVFNDVFDHKLDSVERPERPIPNGTITLTEAVLAGSVLLLLGISSAFFVNTLAGTCAILIALAALSYNKWSKHNVLTGPLNMGICRGLNLLLGVSIIPAAVFSTWHIAFVPLIYIAAITLISRGEVHGSSRKPLYLAAAFYILAAGLILTYAFHHNTTLFAVLFLLPFLGMIFQPLLRAVKEPSGPNIGKAVKAGVIGLILMNAAWAASAGAFNIALLIFLLLPLSLGLSRMFAVT
ncbi:MAG: UbiA-like protein EboC [Bacteroidia bacterium]